MTSPSPKALTYFRHPSNCNHIIKLSMSYLYPPASTKLQRSWKGLLLVSPCPSVGLSVCPSVDRIVSALYLQQYSSDPFYICTSYQATSEGVSLVMPVSKLKNLKFWRIFCICNFDFVFFWLGIQYDSMVWVIIRRRGVSSERTRSSCPSCLCCISYWTAHMNLAPNLVKWWQITCLWLVIVIYVCIEYQVHAVHYGAVKEGNHGKLLLDNIL